MTRHIVLKTKNLISKPKAGFTLIELLVVVSIIGLLASIVVVSLGGARRGGRDTKAAAELRQIQTALELAYDASGPPNAYKNLPDVWTAIAAAQNIVGGATTFMDPVPTGTGANNYEWCDNLSPSNTYRLRVNLEDDKLGSLIGDCYYVTNTGVKAGVCTVATGCTLP